MSLKYTEVLTCQFPDFLVEGYFRENVSHGCVHVFHKNNMRYLGFFLVVILLTPLDGPYILPHFSPELFTLIFLYLSIVQIVRTGLGSSEIIDHRTQIVYWFQDNDVSTN